MEKPVLFRDVELNEGFFIRSKYGDIPFYKITPETALVMANIHFQYTMGMDKKFNQLRQVLIKT